ncbi:Zn-dependent hydrolase [Acuticoccus sp. MNP-M23]|uniref:Zn-dependent hydrolase n=1 Tax=Acuticoccus sp. MNP-M23 TaxID=3072793 RepID=UPI0028157141|nr:Zn-dependent hydrolase [Acuticoccus sp. MNP-M23]WMS43579.1 Zn-dependent hydrolase [Acuticoccus sp. MNP-M23]
MTSAPLAIDPARLAALIGGINAFGRNAETGGFDRVAFSEADMAARAWFADEMRRDGLTVSTDGAGNLFGRYGPADGSCIMAGSHLDTVPDGGAFDGVIGCAAALEAVRTMQDRGIVPATAIEVVATADEEGRFGGMLGSQAITGTATAEFVAAAVAADGVRLTDAMRQAGLDPAAVPGAARAPGSVRAFIELHIEQGPVLEQSRAEIGIAGSVSGVCVLAVTLTGRANHSGTTPMTMRADAFQALAEIGAALPDLASRHGTDQTRITIGHVSLSPNAVHTIAGEARFTIVLRDTARPVMVALMKRIENLVANVGESLGVMPGMETASWLDPVRLDTAIVDLLTAECSRLGYRMQHLPSGAGHDAQTMAALCPTGLIFVPSRNGISHAPAEFTGDAEIARGATVLANALMQLSS